MSIFDFLTLFGGLAMFLYGMRLMGDGLKESSSGTLKKAMESVTNNQFKAFLLGLGITAIIQSSTATIVITSGLVGAGLLTLHQSIGIIIGANVGTTVTGQIIRLLDLDTGGGATSWLQLFKPSSLAPIALIIGIIIIMGGRLKSSRQIGNIAIGFGILFSGLMNMTAAVNVLTESGMVEGLFTGLGNNPVLGYLTGAAVAFVLQSSSATIGILQAFSAFGVFMMRQFYQGIPDSLCEAARIDGMSEYRIYLKIMLPLSKPAISTLLIFTFVNTWNDFLGPLIYLTSERKKTLQLGLKMFISQYSAEYGLIMAASVLSLIPVLIVFLSLQKYFVEGVASSGVKG